MDRPNVLILMTDQHRWDALAAAGNGDIRTPNLDALAGEGVMYENHFVQNPVCMPSRMSLLTGQYPGALGIVRNGTPLPADAETLATRLGRFGYVSANLGKLHFLPHAERDHTLPHPAYGFDHLEISDEPGCYPDAYRAWVARRAPEELDRISVGLPPAAERWQQAMGVRDGIVHPPRGEHDPRPFSGRSDLTHSAFVAERTMAYLRQRARAGEPFACVAGFYSPHAPPVAPEEFFDLYDRDALSLPEFPPEIEEVRAERGFDDAALRAARHGYYAQVSEVDHHCGRILAALADLGLAERTIVVFTADHGEYLGEHLRYGKGCPAEDVISRVPMLVRYPEGGLAGGRRIDAMTEGVDLLPSLLAWCGLPVADDLPGRTLPVEPAEEGRPSALCEGEGWVLLRTRRHRYVLYADGREALNDVSARFGAYRDISSDPAQAATLSACRAELARRMIERQRYRPRVAQY